MGLRGALAIVLALLAACAPAARERAGARRIALGKVRDFAGAPGSGERIRARLATRLSLAGLEVERHGGRDIAFVSLTDYSREKPLVTFDYPVPPSQPTVLKWASAHVSLVGRLIDVRTGTVLWAASSTSRPDAFDSALDYTYRLTIDEAADQAAARLADQLAQKLNGP